VRTDGHLCGLAEKICNCDHDPSHKCSKAGKQQKITQDYRHEGLPCPSRAISTCHPEYGLSVVFPTLETTRYMGPEGVIHSRGKPWSREGSRTGTTEPCSALPGVTGS